MTINVIVVSSTGMTINVIVGLDPTIFFKSQVLFSALRGLLERGEGQKELLHLRMNKLKTLLMSELYFDLYCLCCELSEAQGKLDSLLHGRFLRVHNDRFQS